MRDLLYFILIPSTVTYVHNNYIIVQLCQVTVQFLYEVNLWTHGLLRLEIV